MLDCDDYANKIFSHNYFQYSLNRPNGVRFVAPAGTTEFAKRWNPQPGDIVSFKHRGFMLSSSKPKLPTLYRIRNDISWDDVAHKSNERIITPSGLKKIFAPSTQN